MQIGKYNKLPHYTIVGDATMFYVWIAKDSKGSNTKWIKGREAFTAFNKLRGLYRKDKKEFMKYSEYLFNKYSKNDS